MAEPETSPLDLPPPTLGESYRAEGSAYDEMCSAGGMLRPHWRELLRVLEEMGSEELERRNDELQGLLQENGVTYNVHGDPRDSQRPWILDPVPLLMTEQEWEPIEAGLRQRSQLLNLLLEDLYGPHTLIRQGLLPPELIYAYPGFRRPCHNSLPPDRRWLVFHAIDLRAPRTAPSGYWAIGRNPLPAPVMPWKTALSWRGPSPCCIGMRRCGVWPVFWRPNAPPWPGWRCTIRNIHMWPC